MTRSRLASRLLASAGALGAREELVGDLLEEIARGRSRLWLCHQLVGLYGWTLAARAREHARLTPSLVALALGAALTSAALIASVGSVLEAWLSFYLAAGTLSLFAHMAARAQVNARL